MHKSNWILLVKNYQQLSKNFDSDDTDKNSGSPLYWITAIGGGLPCWLCITTYPRSARRLLKQGLRLRFQIYDIQVDVS